MSTCTGDNPFDKARGLTPVQMDNHGIEISLSLHRVCCKRLNHGFPTVRGDNQLALASELSPIHVITFYF